RDRQPRVVVRWPEPYVPVPNRHVAPLQLEGNDRRVPIERHCLDNGTAAPGPVVTILQRVSNSHRYRAWNHSDWIAVGKAVDVRERIVEAPDVSLNRRIS